jgi:glycosyltransferase involved in cell wall biosynthesis
MAEFTGKVLLLGNYAHDRQESMRHFAQMLYSGLMARGVEVEMVRPEPAFGRIAAGADGIAKWFGYFDKFVIFPGQLNKKLRTLGARDALHICDHSNSVYTKYAIHQAHLVTCHDLLAVRSAQGEFPENPTSFTGRIYQRMILRGLNRAHRVACVSNATEADVRRLTDLPGERVTVVENGLNHSYGPLGRGEAMQRLQTKMSRVPKHFILHVGGNQWYKNRAGVIRIYAEFLRVRPDGPDLLLAGKRLPESLLAEIDLAKIRERVYTLHDCDNEDLRAAYSAAEALLFPSLAEGFGWPIIEAQACGCPVITSNFAPMNDIGGEAAAYFNPRDEASAARALAELLWEGGLEKAVRKSKGFANAARFSADRMIDRYLEEYATVANA